MPEISFVETRGPVQGQVSKLRGRDVSDEPLGFGVGLKAGVVPVPGGPQGGQFTEN